MGQPHVVIFPYNEQGHINPAFALGRALANRGVQVTCVVSATRYASSSSSSNNISSSSLLRVEAIPDDCETDAEKDICFQHSLQKLEPGLEQLMARLQPAPSCLISDILYPWSQDLADRLALPRFLFSAHVATACLLAFHLPSLIAKGFLPFKQGMEDELIDFIPGLMKNFRLADVLLDFLGRDSVQLEVSVRIQRSMKKGAGIVLNTVYELEQDALDALSAAGLSVYAVGPLSNMDWENNCHQNIASLYTENDECMHWLDSQPPGSVVYVALGSINSLSVEEVHQCALGLEACAQPFLWVIRQPPGETHPAISTLPKGFLERTKQKGRVISWAPQTAVLSHPSMGCFLNGHCGSGSVLEALWAGVPMIAGCFYKISDQNTIFKLITEEWEVAMALQDPKAVRSGHAPSLKSAIETSVKEVMHGPRGMALTHKVMQLKTTLTQAVGSHGSSYLSLNRLVHALNE